jgi:hypothetical protein
MYLQAYIELDKARPIGFTAGYIPLGAILEYGNYLRLTEDEIEDLITVIRVVDNLLKSEQE